MATQWYWRDQEIDQGPVSFRELVTLVRDRALTEDDLVRPHYSIEWQHAATVVGLFHMAGRSELLALWEDERRQAENASVNMPVDSERIASSNDSIRLDDFDEMLNAAEILPDLHPEEPAWRVRLREVELQTSQKESELRDALVADQLQWLKNEVIALAMEKIELKETARRSHWMLTSWIRFRSGEPLKRGFHWGLSFVVALATAVGVHYWSTVEFMRFPGNGAGPLGLRPFPLFGECSPIEYAFLLMDTTLVAGAIGFGLSRLLVNLTDEV